MAIFSFFVHARMHLLRPLLLCIGLSVPAVTASASGPVERLVQLLADPSDPSRLAVRYGLASEGFLFSRDGGRTFRAMCLGSIAPERKGIDRLKRISDRDVPGTAATVIDGRGRILFSIYGSGWTDDGTGCAWSSIPELDGKWALSMKRDPTDANTVWAAVSTSTGDGADVQTRMELMRRDDAGKWTTAAPIRALPRGQLVLEADLLVAVNGSGLRHYVLMQIAGLNQTDRWVVVVSDDNGRTWQEHVLPKPDATMRLLTVDPSDHRRILAVSTSDSDPDDLLLSEDGGATFRKYGALRAVSDVTFDAKGRIFVADAGDSASETTVGGLYTAARLGEPLTRVGDTEYADCVQHHPQTGKLFYCSRDHFGIVDPESGALTELVRIETVPGLLECEGRDMHALCQNDLNAGPAWCCAGHFPFTSFCGDYDVTKTPEGRTVYCGLTGREYDRPSGSGDGGTTGRDAGVSDDEGATAARPRGASSSKSDGGCSLAARSPASPSALVFALLALGTVVRRIRARRRPDA